MYSRQIGEQHYTFEASGGLINASLIMQDRETDSYWSIMTETAIHGDASGAELEVLPGSVKMTWGEWRSRHPSTKILSVEGREHDPGEGYARYFASDRGFRGLSTEDRRLEDKASIYALQYDGNAHAVPHDSFHGGGVVTLGDRQLFLYREKDDSFYRSTVALLAPEGGRFVREGDTWTLAGQQSSDGGSAGDRVSHAFDPTQRHFEGGGATPFNGFDTFWYIWSRMHEDTDVSKAAR